MIADDFAKEYLGSFVIDEKTQLLHEIAKEYHNACDAYDSLVCDKNADGDFYPATDWQFVQINVHARLVLKRLVEQHAGFSRLEILRAIQDYACTKRREHGN